MNNFNDKIENVKFFFDAASMFCRYEYWSKELWRKLKGRKYQDAAEVHVAMLHYWFYEMYGIYTIACGSSWFIVCNDIPEYNLCAKDIYLSYIDNFKDIIEDYKNWVEKQR